MHANRVPRQAVPYSAREPRCPRGNEARFSNSALRSRIFVIKRADKGKALIGFMQFRGSSSLRFEEEYRGTIDSPRQEAEKGA